MCIRVQNRAAPHECRVRRRGLSRRALRLVPADWEFVWLDRTWTLALLVPLAIVLIYLLLVLVYPFVEEWISGDHRDHHLLDRLRNAPTRTGIGVAAIFYGTVWIAASADLISTHFSVTCEGVITVLQATLVWGPAIGFFITKRVCLALQRKDHEVLVRGFETGRIVRLPGGEYIEVHPAGGREPAVAHRGGRRPACARAAA